MMANVVCRIDHQIHQYFVLEQILWRDESLLCTFKRNIVYIVDHFKIIFLLNYSFVLKVIFCYIYYIVVFVMITNLSVIIICLKVFTNGYHCQLWLSLYLLFIVVFYQIHYFSCLIVCFYYYILNIFIFIFVILLSNVL